MLKDFSEQTTQTLFNAIENRAKNLGWEDATRADLDRFMIGYLEGFVASLIREVPGLREKIEQRINLIK